MSSHTPSSHTFRPAVAPNPVPVRSVLRKFVVAAMVVSLLLAGMSIALTRLGQWVSNFGVTPDPIPAPSAPSAQADAAPAPPKERRRRATPLPPVPKLNAEGVPVCVPKTCATEEADCGSISDGCGGTLDCGGCAEGYECGGEKMHTCVFQCEPLSCKEKFADCGEVDDGCGKKISCGKCKSGETCGGDGIANECGKGICYPTTCRERDLANGRFSDGCGGVIDC